MIDSIGKKLAAKARIDSKVSQTKLNKPEKIKNAVPLNSADKLGFTEVKELIKAHCLSVMGQQMVDKIQVMSNYDLINKFLNQANEFKNILQNDAALPINQLL
jgi:hypothetical protein